MLIIKEMDPDDLFHQFEMDRTKYDSFSYCVKLGHTDIFDVLIKRCPPRSLEAAFCRHIPGLGNLFHLAIQCDSQEMIQYLLKEYREQIKPLMKKDNHPFSKEDIHSGLIPLQLAAANKNDFAFAHILEKFPELANYANSSGGNRTVAHISAIFGFEIGIKRLFHAGTQFKAKDLDGKTPEDFLSESDKGKSILKSLRALAVSFDQRGHSQTFFRPQNLVFSGGGPRGLAYVGSLRALERKDCIKGIERVCGTSAGAITAGLGPMKRKGPFLIILENSI
jgi:hypothetical protein